MMESKNFDVLFNHQKCEFVTWNIHVGSSVDPGLTILVFKQNGSERKLKSKVHGVVVHLSKFAQGSPIPYRFVVARIRLTCSHPIVMKDMCAHCGENLRRKNGLPGERLSSTSAQVAMIHSIPELQISPQYENVFDHYIVSLYQEAKKYGFIEKLRLLRSRRLVLLVDLDQTLIHTTNEDIPPTMKNVMHFQLDGPTWYHMRMRPHTLEFLHSVSQKFELHICSFGARMYAHTVARMMDPDGALFGLRILSRDECFDPFLKTANLKALFPCGDHLVCIIDDREDVWNFASNVVHVKPYRFFKHTGDINAPPGFTKADRNEENNVEANDKSTPERNKKEVGDVSEPALRPSSSAVISKSPTKEATSAEIVDDDNYLKSLEKILFRIHDAFYQMYDQMPDEERPPCLHSIIPYVKLKVLKGVNLVFSGIIPTHVKPETTQIFKVAEAFGAQIQNQIVSTSDSKDPSKWTTHLVACKWGTEKVLQAYDLDHVHIVIPEWLWSCAERWTKVDPEPFCLTPPNSRSKLVKRSPVDRSSCIVEKLANDKMDFSPSAVHNGRRRVADADLEETEDVTYSAENSSLAYNLEPARKRPAINSSVQAEVPRSSNRFEQVSVNDSDISSSSAESEDDISTDEIVDDLERCIAE